MEDALSELQRIVQLPAPTEQEPQRTFASGRIPDDLAESDAKMLYLLEADATALEQLRWLIPHDLRFEYQDKRERDECTWRFVCEAHLKPEGSHVETFIERRGRTPERLECFFPVELLGVPAELTFHGARFIPAADVEALPVNLSGHHSNPPARLEALLKGPSKDAEARTELARTSATADPACAPRTAHPRQGRIIDAICRVLADERDPLQAREVHARVETLLGEPVRWSSIKATLAGNLKGSPARFVRVARGRYSVAKSH